MDLTDLAPIGGALSTLILLLLLAIVLLDDSSSSDDACPKYEGRHRRPVERRTRDTDADPMAWNSTAWAVGKP